MNVRKLLARLNATTVKFDLGRGGLPEFTAQDIAAALATVSNTLARDILVVAWWPDGAALSRDTVATALRNEVMREFSRRHRAAQIARLDLHLVECELAARRARTRDDEQALARAQGAVDSTRVSLWPGSAMSVYPLVVNAALLELVTPRHCSTCEGRGNVATDVGPRPCATCEGSGQRAQSNVWRARQLGHMDESSYRSIWRPVYEWTFNYIEGLERQAAAQMARALADLPTEPEPADA